MGANHIESLLYLLANPGEEKTPSAQICRSSLVATMFISHVGSYSIIGNGIGKGRIAETVEILLIKLTEKQISVTFQRFMNVVCAMYFCRAAERDRWSV